MSSLVRLLRGRYGRPPVAKSSEPSKPVLSTSYSPQEGYLEEGEDMLSSAEEFSGNVADHCRGHGDSREQLDGASGRDTRREDLFQHFYLVIQKAWDREKPSDCIIVSINKEQREYATGIGHRLRDRGLMVETIHLASESRLECALQEIRDDGCPFCILVEQPNVKHSSCTVIMLHESIKIHRHMPLEDALVLVDKEFRHFLSKKRAGVSQKAAELVDDVLAREHLTRHSLPPDIQHLLFLLSEGKHLYVDELSLIVDYLETRKEQLQGCDTPDPSASSQPASLQGRITPMVGRPPPRLPAPGPKSHRGAPPPGPVKWLSGDHPGGGRLPLPGLANPKGLLPHRPPVGGPSKRPAPLACPRTVPAKHPAPGEKPGLPAPQPVLRHSVPHKRAVQPVTLLTKRHVAEPEEQGDCGPDGGFTSSKDQGPCLTCSTHVQVQPWV